MDTTSFLEPSSKNQAFASTLRAGSFGGINYSLDSSGVMTISPNTTAGSTWTAGTIPSNTSSTQTFFPWANDSRVTKIVFTAGTTYTTGTVADYLFANLPSLTSITTGGNLNMTATPSAFHLFDGDTALAAAQAAKTSGQTVGQVASGAAIATNGVSWSVTAGTLTIGAGTLPSNTNDDPTFWPWYYNSAITKIVVGGAATGGTPSTANMVNTNASIGYLYANLPNLTRIQSTNGANDYFNGMLSGTSGTATATSVNDASNLMINDPQLNLSPKIGTSGYGSTAVTSSMASISTDGKTLTFAAVAQANNSTNDPTFWPWAGDSAITTVTSSGTFVASGAINANKGTIPGTGTQTSFASSGSFLFANLSNLSVINRFIAFNMTSGPADESFLFANDQSLTGNPSTGASSVANVNAYFATNATSATIIGGNGLFWMPVDVRAQGSGSVPKTFNMNGIFQNCMSLSSIFMSTDAAPSGVGSVFDMNSAFQGASNVATVNMGGNFTLASGATYTGAFVGASSLTSVTGMSASSSTTTGLASAANTQVTAVTGSSNNNSSNLYLTAGVISGTPGTVYLGQQVDPSANLNVVEDVQAIYYNWPNSAIAVAYSTDGTNFSSFVSSTASATTLNSILPASLFNTTTGKALSTSVGQTYYVKYQYTGYVSSDGTNLGSPTGTMTSTPVAVKIAANQASLKTTASTTMYIGTNAATSFTPLSVVSQATNYDGSSILGTANIDYTIKNSSSQVVTASAMLATFGTYTITFNLVDGNDSPILDSSGNPITATATIVMRAEPTLAFANASDATVILAKGGTFTPLTNFNYTGYNGGQSNKVVMTSVSGSGTSVDTSKYGSYIVTYTMEDTSGNIVYDGEGNAMTLQQTVIIDAATLNTIKTSSIGNYDPNFNPYSLVTVTDAQGNSVAKSAISYTYTLNGVTTVSGTQADFASNFATWLNPLGIENGTMTFTFSYTDTATNQVLTGSTTVNVLKDGTIFQTENGTTDNQLNALTPNSWNPLVLISKITDDTGSQNLYTSTVGTGAVPPSTISSNISYSIVDAKGQPVADVATMLLQSGTYMIIYNYTDSNTRVITTTSFVTVNEGLFLNTAPSFSLSTVAQVITGAPITVPGTARGGISVVNAPATANGWSINASLSNFTAKDASNNTWALTNTALNFVITNTNSAVVNGPQIMTVNGTNQSTLIGDGLPSTLISAPGQSGLGTNSFNISQVQLVVSGSDLYNIVPKIQYNATITWTVSDSATVIK